MISSKHLKSVPEPYHRSEPYHQSLQEKTLVFEKMYFLNLEC